MSTIETKSIKISIPFVSLLFLPLLFFLANLATDKKGRTIMCSLFNAISMNPLNESNAVCFSSKVKMA